MYKPPLPKELLTLTETRNQSDGFCSPTVLQSGFIHPNFLGGLTRCRLPTHVTLFRFPTLMQLPLVESAALRNSHSLCNSFPNTRGQPTVTTLFLIIAST